MLSKDIQQFKPETLRVQPATFGWMQNEFILTITDEFCQTSQLRFNDVFFHKRFLVKHRGKIIYFQWGRLTFIG